MCSVSRTASWQLSVGFSRTANRSKRRPQGNLQHGAALETSWRQLAAIEVEPELDANRKHSRTIVHAEAGCGPQIGQADVCGVLENVAGVHEDHSGERTDDVDPKLAVQEDFPLPPVGKPPGLIVSSLAS